jgi:CelD/BcsL family acetyltransferase involved in cellulose biosynthesis
VGTRRLDPIADPAWMELLERSPGAQAFHHPGWLELLRDQYGYTTHAVCVEEAGQLVAGLPVARVESRLTGRRHVALPFTDNCPPVLAAGADPASLGALGEALSDERDQTGLDLHVHGELREIPGAALQQRFYAHLLPLAADVTEVERHFSKSQVRRGIKRAVREGLVATRRTDRAGLDLFYGLHVGTRRRLGVPTQPRSFIRSFASLFEQGLGFVQLVELDGRAIAAGVFLTFNKTMIYKYGASDARELGRRPNNLLFMETIRFGCESGYRTLDFGRTDLDNEGLRAFKRSWGAEEVPLSYTFLGDGSPSLGTSRARALMATVIRNSPPSVGRLIGRSLYRHAG